MRAGRAAIAAEHGEARVRDALRARSVRATKIIAVGKAAAAMAAGCSGARGIVVSKEREPVPEGFRHLLAGHPLPDERSVAATRAVLAEVAALAADDELLLLLSGGTSALLGGPIDGVHLDEVRALVTASFVAGLGIDELNCLRRRVGAALGGRLGAATRASIFALVLSDVASDDPRVIGSGPVSPPPEDDAQRALTIASRLGLSAGLSAALRDAPQPRLHDRIEIRILANPHTLAESAARALTAEGFTVERSAMLASGSVEELAALMHARARSLAPGAAFVIVGEPTVRVQGSAPGGRAQHLALSALSWLRTHDDMALLALASDGSDGTTDAAGAVVDAASARAAGDARAALAAFESHRALRAIGALIVTGPTGTNLTDLYVVARRS